MSASQNYVVYFSADSMTARDNESLSTSKFTIVTTINTTHESEIAINMPKRVFNPWESRRRVTKIMNHSPTRAFSFEGHSLTWDILSRATSDANIPFALDRLQWRGDPRKDWTPLKNQDDLFRRILDVTSCIDSLVSNSTAHHKEFLLILSIEKKIILPHHEFEAMVRATNVEELVRDLSFAVSLLNRQQNRTWDTMMLQPFKERCAELGIDSLESLIDRATRELAEREGSKLIPATKLSIEALEEVILDGVDHSTPSCSICLENMVIGSPVTCMPCSHKFHKTCIILWLQRSHKCPLCRFELPTIN